MATGNTLLVVSREAAEDLSSDQYRFVVLDAGKIRRPNSASEIAFGVLQDAPESGRAGSVCVQGITKVVGGGALTENSYVKPEYNDASDAGKAVVTTTADDNVRGIVVDPTTAEDEVGSILLMHMVIPTPGS